MKPRIAIVVTCLTAFFPAAPLAQWRPDGAPICTQADEQLYANIVSDGAGGAIAVWSDRRVGTHHDIYAQRLDAAGVPQWTADGVALCTAAHDQIAPSIATDGTGGAIVTWYDRRSGTNYDIYAQRVDASGAPQWTSDGVALCTAVLDQYSPKLVSDGAGGAIVVWDDDRTGAASYDVYVQRVNAAGVPQWTDNGVALCLQGGDQAGSRIDSDGAGGAVVAWHDYRNSNYDIFVQRVNASGTPLWTPEGVAICVDDTDQSFPTVASDGSGGAIVTWADPRSGGNDIFAQRVNAAGVVQWTVDGTGLVTAASDQSNPELVTDGAEGAIVTWYDTRNGSADIFSQRVSPSGASLWAPDGVALCTAPNHQGSPKLVADGAGGAIVAWLDLRSDGDDIYAQRVSDAGVPQWAADGLAVCTAAGDQSIPVLALDGVGEAFVAWHDHRNGTDADIYAQRVHDTPTGIADTPPFPVLMVGPNRPNPFATTTEMEIGLRQASSIEIEVFDAAGRRVRAQTMGPRSAGLQKIPFDARDQTGRLLPSGVYFYQVRANGSTVTSKMVIVR